MNNCRRFNILVWNIRGINSKEKWDAIRAKISESSCQIVCLQETKRESFDQLYTKNFCPKNLDSFAFSPSSGASGGIITLWNSSIFTDSTIQANAYCVTVKFINNLDNNYFFLSNVYGPSHANGKLAFVTWFLNFDFSLFDDWIVSGDFNMYRSSDDRYKPGGDIGDTNLFNNLISDLELLEIPFSGRTYTWSNMQLNPLLVKLDWVFCSANWNLSYMDTTVQTLSRPILDHTPFVLSFGSTIPKTDVFRFENY
jgi:exonuclease III